MQLPESPRQHDLERASVRELDRLIPHDLFLVRETSESDYGSDQLIELRIDGRRMSNMTFHVQLKATEQAAKVDGSHTLALKVSTYNYLRNQPNSIVVVHTPKLGAGSFKWAWVDDVWKQARESGVDFDTTDQKTFSYAFRRCLDHDAWVDIHRAVHDRSVMHRRISELLTLAAAEEVPELLVRGADDVVDLGSVERDVLRYGFALINMGRFDVLDRLIDRLPHKTLKTPRIGAVVSFARLGQGRHQEALAALPRPIELSNCDAQTRQVCAFVRLGAQRSLGQLSESEWALLVDEVRELGPQSMLSMSIELQTARDAFFRSRTSRDLGPAQEALAEACRRLKAAASNDIHFQLLIEITDWEFRGIQLTRDVLDLQADDFMRTNLGFPPQNGPRVLERLAELRGWFMEGESIEERLKEHGSLFLGADFVLAYGRVMACTAMSMCGLRAMGLQLPELPGDVYRSLAGRVSAVTGALEHMNCLEYACRGRILEAELLDLAGESALRSLAADKAHRLALQIDNPTLLKVSEDAVAGRFAVHELVQAVKCSKADLDLDLSSAEDRDRFTRDMLKNLGVPADRFTVARKCVEDDAYAAREQRLHCRHLELREELQPKDPLVLYRRPPKRRALCARLRLWSAIPHEDGAVVLDSFKNAHCKGCGLRLPRAAS
ncbi:MAG: DUF4365 domain-containing protein [Planctomycetes bacterium]|nr:DUF4365 domain-containing protein [Planctomycetota bacterium]